MTICSCAEESMANKSQLGYESLRGSNKSNFRTLNSDEKDLCGAELQLISIDVIFG